MTTETKEATPAPEPKERMDTKAKYTTWLNSFSENSRQALNQFTRAAPYNQIMVSAPDGWWVAREKARMLYDFGQEYYELPGDVLELLKTYNALPLPFHFVHISTTDETKIAYTESWEAGVADRQQQISLGKYIKKYFPHVPEFVIKQAQEALNNRIKVAEVLFTRDWREMLNIYCACQPACMSKPLGYGGWKIPSHLHPLMAYEAPGFALAYIRGKAANYQSRCMVWDNPDNPNDKRFTRLYGDTLIGAQLQRLGYRRTHFGGAKLKRIDYNYGDRSHILCPYIDDHGSGQQGTGLFQAVQIFSDHLLIVDKTKSGAHETSPSGYVVAPPWSPPWFDRADVDAAASYPDAASGHAEFLPPRTTDGQLQYVVGTSNGHFHWMGVRSIQDLERYTIPLHPRGRVFNDSVAVRAWGVVRNTSERLGPVGNMMSLRATAGSYSSAVQLTNGGEVCNDHQRRLMAIPGIAHEDEVQQTYPDGGFALKHECLQITGGSQAGKWVHKGHIATFVDSGLIYILDDSVTTFNGVIIPREHAACAPNSDMWFDRRVSALHPQFNIPTGISREIAVSLDGVVYQPYDDLLIRDREENVSRGMSSYNVLIDRTMGVIDKLVIQDNILMYSAAVTDGGRHATRQWLDANGTNGLKRALQQSVPGYKQSPLIGDEWAQFFNLMVAANPPAPAAVDIVPQPETAAVSPATTNQEATA